MKRYLLFRAYVEGRMNASDCYIGGYDDLNELEESAKTWKSNKNEYEIFEVLDTFDDTWSEL